jgi:peptide/nickel transport system substrate-binding protein
MLKRLLLIVTLILALGLAACTGVTVQQAPPPAAEKVEEAEEAPPAAAEAEEAMPAKELPPDAAGEQVLRIATGSTGANSFTFFPMTGGGDHQSWMPLLWTPPMYFDAEGNLKPGVFRSWEPNADFTEWVFQIDPRAKWSDGSPITAADVKGAWELMADPLTEHGRITQYIGNVQGFDAVRNQETKEMTGLEVIDDLTIRVKLKKADAIFHWRIATTHMNPVKVEQARADLNWWLPENNPASSGPYMLETYKPDLGEASMAPNPNWWMDEGPYLDRITFQFITDQNTAATMVQNDQVDFVMTGLPPALKEQFPAYFRPIKAIGFNSFWLAATVEPTDDINVRKALLLSVNLDDVFKAAHPEGDAARATQLLDPDVSCFDTANSWYEYNPEAAKEALAASKYGSAENLPKLRVTPRGTSDYLNRALEAVIEFWRQNLGITNVEFKTTPDEFGDDAALINLSRDDVVIRFPDGATYAWVGSHSEGPIAREMMLGYNNPQVNALLEEAIALPVDDPKRCELTQEAQRVFMNDYQGIFFSIPESYGSVSSPVKNFLRGPDVGLIEPWKIYIGNE